jgi:hypothetical protein
VSYLGGELVVGLVGVGMVAGPVAAVGGLSYVVGRILARWRS